ncbi:hypothetical protein NL676_021425 [Syzygium grande]|nr:hypothetical protein NL676_021425 [Syzygium grande]
MFAVCLLSLLDPFKTFLSTSLFLICFIGDWPEHFAALPFPPHDCTGTATTCGGDRFGPSSLLTTVAEPASSVSCPPSLLATAPEPPAHTAVIDLALPISAASVFLCVASESLIPPTVAPPLISFFLRCNPAVRDAAARLGHAARANLTQSSQKEGTRRPCYGLSLRLKLSREISVSKGYDVWVVWLNRFVSSFMSGSVVRDELLQVVGAFISFLSGLSFLGGISSTGFGFSIGTK